MTIDTHAVTRARTQKHTHTYEHVYTHVHTHTGQITPLIKFAYVHMPQGARVC